VTDKTLVKTESPPDFLVFENRLEVFRVEVMRVPVNTLFCEDPDDPVGGNVVKTTRVWVAGYEKDAHRWTSMGLPEKNRSEKWEKCLKVTAIYQYLTT
jgi:hypothetical protein